MVGQVIRAVEVPISLSIGVARRGVALAGRVAGWAVTGIVRELSPDRREQRPPARAEERPPAAPPTPAWEPAGREEPAVAVNKQPTAPIEEEQEPRQSDGAPAAAPPLGSEEPEPAPVSEAETESPPVGGENGEVVEHEPGLGTSVRAPDPHSALNNPITEPDTTEWPDPYDHREDPRDPGDDMVFGADAGHTQTGATSTSEPHPSHDPEAEPWEGPKRDKVDQ